MLTVVTYGTFDLFHVGHVRLLQRARALGDRLIVGLSTDAFTQLKGKSVVTAYAERAEILRGCRFVDAVFEEDNWEQKRTDIVRFGAGLFVMGSDWAGKFDELSDICKVAYLSRTPDISTTQIKHSVAHLFPAGIELPAAPHPSGFLPANAAREDARAP